MNTVVFSYLKFLPVLFLFSSYLSNAQTKISGQQFNEDVQQLVTSLKKYYPGLYYYESMSEFDERLSKIYRADNDSIAVGDAYREIAGFVAGSQDLHLSVALPKKYFTEEVKVMPFVIRRFGEDFYIAYNQSSDSAYVRGDRLLTINDVSLMEDFTLFRNLYGADFGNPYSKNYYAEMSFPAFYTRWYGQQDSVRLRYQPLADSVFHEQSLSFLPPKVAMGNMSKRYKNVLRRNFDLVQVDSVTRTAKLDITSFRGGKGFLNFGDRKFKKNIRRSFRKIESDSTENLILDLRGNGGGAVVNIHRLLSYVTQEPFRIYDSVYVKKEAFRQIFKPYYLIPPLVGKLYLKKNEKGDYYRSFTSGKRTFKPVKKHGFTGNLYVLMDGGSYSATTFTISLLKNMNRATFVGTPPGGANWGSFAGFFHKVKLDESKIRVSVPLMQLIHSSENRTHSDYFVQPDYFVGQGFTDFINRKDSQVDFVRQLISNKK